MEVAEVRSETSSLFEALAVMLGYQEYDDVERIREQVIDTLIQDWESLRVFDVDNLGRSYYGEDFSKRKREEYNDK